MKEPSAAQLAARFQPGDKGNPKGRKKRGFSLAATLARFGHKKNPETKHRYYDDMVIGIWKRAAQGDMEATKYIMDRVLGRPAQEIKLDTQQPALVFQILDPRLPASDDSDDMKHGMVPGPLPRLPGPEPQQETVDGEVWEVTPGTNLNTGPGAKLTVGLIPETEAPATIGDPDEEGEVVE